MNCKIYTHLTKRDENKKGNGEFGNVNNNPEDVYITLLKRTRGFQNASSFATI